jgi:hypothetical protein
LEEEGKEEERVLTLDMLHSALEGLTNSAILLKFQKNKPGLANLLLKSRAKIIYKF